MSAFFNPNDTLGAALIGFAFSCVVFGVNTNQVVTYFQRYPEDKLAYKFLVSLIWVLELIDQAFIGHFVYFYTVTNFSNPLVLITQPVAWTLILQITVGAIIGTIVRLCFAMRVWRFSQRNITVTSAVVALTLAELGLATAYTVKCFQSPFLTTIPNLKLLASLSLGAGVLTDVFTASALCVFLRKFRTGHKRSDTLVNTLTIYAVNTGAFTAAISLLTLIFYDLHPDNFQFLAFYFILSKLYAISFLCTLNTRKIIRGKGTEREDGPTTGASGANMNISSNHFYISHVPRTGTDTSGFGGQYGQYSGQYSTTARGDGSVAKGLEIGVHQEVSISSDLESQTMTASSPYSSPYAHPYMR
ncbi:hypothetical protein C8R43DRAFT_1031968 [Mycena crocata]|nr:hypothetical protein C8R43DRAFT_1031968 [Mycena crocata]